MYGNPCCHFHSCLQCHNLCNNSNLSAPDHGLSDSFLYCQGNRLGKHGLLTVMSKEAQHIFSYQGTVFPSHLTRSCGGLNFFQLNNFTVIDLRRRPALPGKWAKCCQTQTIVLIVEFFCLCVCVTHSLYFFVHLNITKHLYIAISYPVGYRHQYPVGYRLTLVSLHLPVKSLSHDN